jgi:hypothetical protein
MNSPSRTLADAFGTSGITNWILNNALPLLLLLVALLILYLGGSKGDNAGVMRRVGGVCVALALVGLVVTGLGIDFSKGLAHVIFGA